MYYLVQFSQNKLKLSIVQACLGICSHSLWNHSSHPSHATIGSSSNSLRWQKLVPFPHVLLSWHTSLLLKENVSFAGPPDSHIDVVSSQLSQTESFLIPVHYRLPLHKQWKNAHSLIHSSAVVHWHTE